MKKLWLKWRCELSKQVSSCGKNSSLPITVPSSRTRQKIIFPDSLTDECGHVTYPGQWDINGSDLCNFWVVSLKGGGGFLPRPLADWNVAIMAGDEAAT